MQLEQGTAVGVLQSRHGAKQVGQRLFVSRRQEAEQRCIIEDQFNLRRRVDNNPVRHIDIQCLLAGVVGQAYIAGRHAKSRTQYCLQTIQSHAGLSTQRCVDGCKAACEVEQVRHTAAQHGQGAAQFAKSPDTAQVAQQAAQLPHVRAQISPGYSFQRGQTAQAVTGHQDRGGLNCSACENRRCVGDTDRERGGRVQP